MLQHVMIQLLTSAGISMDSATVVSVLAKTFQKDFMNGMNPEVDLPHKYVKCWQKFSRRPANI